MLTKGDSTASGDTVIGCSSKTFANGTPVTYLGASMSGCPIPGHGGGSIAASGTSGKTKIAGSPPACANGAIADCGCSISASHTSKTYCN